MSAYSFSFLVFIHSTTKSCEYIDYRCCHYMLSYSLLGVCWCYVSVSMLHYTNYYFMFIIQVQKRRNRQRKEKRSNTFACFYLHACRHVAVLVTLLFVVFSLVPFYGDTNEKFHTHQNCTNTNCFITLCAILKI